MPEGLMQVTPEADTDANMIGERHGLGMSGSENEVMGAEKPVDISPMMLGGPIGMQDAARPVPEGREVSGFDVPIPTEYVRDTS